MCSEKWKILLPYYTVCYIHTKMENMVQKSRIAIRINHLVTYSSILIQKRRRFATRLLFTSRWLLQHSILLAVLKRKDDNIKGKVSFYAYFLNCVNISIFIERIYFWSVQLFYTVSYYTQIHRIIMNYWAVYLEIWFLHALIITWWYLNI